MDAKKIIDSLGGTGAVAKACKASPNAVTNWKRRGIPYRVLFKNLGYFLPALTQETDVRVRQVFNTSN